MPAPNGPQWKFLHRAPTEPWQSTHQIIAYPGDVNPEEAPEADVGMMEWFKNNGRVSELFVGKEFRRKGVATGMWNEAKRISKENPEIPEPRHNPQRSRKGDAWARSVGGDLPPLEDGKYMPYYD